MSHKDSKHLRFTVSDPRFGRAERLMQSEKDGDGARGILRDLRDDYAEKHGLKAPNLSAHDGSPYAPRAHRILGGSR